MENQFAQFGLQDFILKALDDRNFTKPTPVQQRVIPIVMSGKSVVGQSQTGSGKTHAYLLPLMNQIEPDKDQVQAVITAPSRELAYQIHKDAEQIAQFSPQQIRVANYVGGTDKKRQVEKLHHQQPQVVIGTPGRILDLTRTPGGLDIHTAHLFVVDEADMTLDMGFLDQVDQIAGQFPSDLQMLVFSATMPEKLKPFLRKYMSHPVVEEIKPATVISPTIENWLLPTQGKNKKELIYHLLTIGEPFLVLIFANTKEHVDELYDYLRHQGLKVARIHGGIEPRKRKQIMREVQNLDYQFVVATDLAARGIDIEGVSHVINAEIPTDPEFFIHRVGRTGRNGMTGIAITLYEPGQENQIAEIESMGIKFIPKVYKKGELVDGYDRDRRAKRVRKHETLDPKMRGLIKKEKKKRKPGYKKKIKNAIQKDEHQRRKIARREDQRQHRQH